MLRVGADELSDRSDMPSHGRQARQGTQTSQADCLKQICTEKSKKANGYRKILSFGEKVAKIPRREPVADRLSEQQKQKDFQKIVLSSEKYAFDDLKTQRILLVGCASEQKLSNYFSRIR